MMVFDNQMLSIQALKSFFVCLLWSETKMFIKDGYLTLVSFFDWSCSC